MFGDVDARVKWLCMRRVQVVVQFFGFGRVEVLLSENALLLILR